MKARFLSCIRGGIPVALCGAMLLYGQGGGAQCLQGDCLEGNGTYFYETGSHYCGQFSGGKKHGPGIFTWIDGKEYRGNFLQDEPDGAGEITLPDGRVREVLFRKGVLVNSHFKAFDIFSGDCRYGSVNLRGDYTGWYKGTPKEGFMPHGRGCMKYQNGSVYTGQWVQGKMHGNGTILWNDGSSYVGEWRQGKRRGFGIYRWPGGKIYAGEWDDNLMSGRGVMQYPDGTVKKGLWKEGSFLKEE